MNSKEKEIRLIIEDHEDVIIWDSSIDIENVKEVAQYSQHALRKKYKADHFTYRDFENEKYSIEEIVKFEVSPIYINVQHRSSVKTYAQEFERNSKAIHSFTDPQSVKVEKFKNKEKKEEVTFKIQALKIMNNANKDKQYEDPELNDNHVYAESAEKINKAPLQLNNPMQFVITTPSKVEDDDDGQSSPTFGGMAPPKQDKNNLGVDTLKKEDLSKRQKVHGQDGKSQHQFVEINKHNKYPLGKKVELQSYTLEDVKKHNKPNDAWMIINGKVYDVTQYIPYHPGGNKILAGIGKDGTALYNQYHPWVNANFLLEKYQVGFIKK